MNWLTVVVLVLMIGGPALFAVSALSTVLDPPERWRRWELKDRIDVVSRLLGHVAFLVVGRQLLPWHELSPVFWGLGVALTAFGAVTCAFAVRELPWTQPGAGRAVRWATGVVGAAIAVAIIGLTAV